MALVKKQSNATRVLMIILVVIIIGGAGFYFYLSRRSSAPQGVATDPALLSVEQNVRDVKTVDESIVPDLERLLQDKRFLELRQYGDLPVEVGPKGRSNPFLPL